MVSEAVEEAYYSNKSFPSLELILYKKDKKNSVFSKTKHIRKIHLIPYRKNQTQIEERVVNIINKLNSGK